VDVRRLDRPGEARPAAAGFELVAGGEQRLARDDVDVNAGLLVGEVLAGAGVFGATLLGDTELLRRQPGDGVGVLAVVGHGVILQRRGSGMDGDRPPELTVTAGRHPAPLVPLLGLSDAPRTFRGGRSAR